MKLAVGIAHGYAKAAREPAACVLHDIVGLLHGTMGIYYAWIDRAPVVVFVARRADGVRPAATEHRLDPHLEPAGNVVRDYTKWDDQAHSIASVPESVMRAYRISSAQPQGPTDVAFDAGLQEDVLDEDVPLPNWDRLRPHRRWARTPTRSAASPSASARPSGPSSLRATRAATRTRSLS